MRRGPRLIRTVLPDKLTAVTAAQAIAAALVGRLKTGKGQHVRLSMLDAVLAFLWASDMGLQTFVGQKVDGRTAASFIDLIYETQNGFMTVAVMTNKEWTALTRALDRPEWLDDPRFKTPALRDQNIDARLQMTQDVLKSRTTEEWLERLEAEGVPCAPVLTRDQVIAHPQVLASGILMESDHEAVGRIRQTRAAARFSETPTELRRGAPRLGEHNAEVLGELGLSRHDIDALRGVIAEMGSDPAGATGTRHDRRRAPSTPPRRPAIGEPILDVLRRHLPRARAGAGGGERLGRACGAFRPGLPGSSFQPSDPDPDARASIDAWSAALGSDQCPPGDRARCHGGDWPIDGGRCRAVHQHDPHRALGRGRGPDARRGRVLPPGGVLYLYGPFKRGGRHTAPSNEAFDRSLRLQNPAWGVRDLEAVGRAGAGARIRARRSSSKCRPTICRSFFARAGSVRPHRRNHGTNK